MINRLLKTAALISVALTLGACSIFGARTRDGLCQAMDDYALAISDDMPHTVTLMNNLSRTDPDVIFGVACRRDNLPSSVAFCEYLSQHASFEFMSNNIGRAFNCIGIQWNQHDNPIFFEHLKGVVKTDKVLFTGEKISVELSFDDSDDNSIPELSFTFRRNATGGKQ